MARKKAPRILWGILKLLFSLLIIAVCTILVWRVFFSAKIPKEVENLQVTPSWQEAFDNGKSLTFLYQDQASITRAKENYGYFSVVKSVYIPEANQVQILFRYNNSTIRHLATDFGLDSVPEKSLHLFDVTLVRTTDLTPDDASDNLDPETLSEERFLPEERYTVRTETQLYTYYRYVFENVTVEDITDGLYVDIYYTGAIDYTADPYGTLCIYANGEEWLDYDLTSADRKAGKR